ncbi:MAG TPA: MBL fold metallo-hydrolase [Candidatus Limnocylindrales bacterium]|nr:MBL fold metallo-hydrolase [Candidatus Limnocylindrales bacterium]
MIEGTAFGARLKAWRPPDGSVGIVALGQAGIALRGRDALVLIDPFLSPRPGRIRDAPVAAADLAGVTLVLATHEHADHLDLEAWPAIAAGSPDARFVVPAPLRSLVVESGIRPDRVVAARPGAAIEHAGVVVTPVPARHGVHVADGYSLGPPGPPRWVGYVVELDGVVIYHAGDSLADPAIVDAVRPHEPQIAFLPINGRDREREARDIVGNMTPDEAAQVAREIAAHLAVPIHFDAIEGNEGRPEAFVAAMRRHHPTASVWVPALGAGLVWPAAGRSWPGPVDGRSSPRPPGA